MLGTQTSQKVKENLLPPKTYIINKNSPVLADLFKIKQQVKTKKNKIASSREPAVKKEITRAKI